MIKASTREMFALSFHLVRRNWTLYKKSFVSNVSPTVFDPIFLIASLGLGLGANVGLIDGQTYSQFLAPGLAASMAMFSAFFETSYGFYVRTKFEGVTAAMLTTPIGVREVVLGELMWVSCKGAVMSGAMAVVLALAGLNQAPWCIPLVALTGTLVALGSGAIGLVACMWVKNIDQFQAVYSFLISPTYFFSGAFFPIERLPLLGRIFAELLPLAHGVRLNRALFSGNGVMDALLLDGPVLVLMGLVLGWIAMVVVSKRLRD